MSAKPRRRIELRRGGPDGELAHVLCWFANGAVQLDGVYILPQNIKAKLGGDGMDLFAVMTINDFKELELEHP